MDQRAALHSGKHNFVDGSGEFLFAQDHTGARSAQSLVRGSGDDMRMRHRRRMHAACNQSGKMRHVHQVKRANFVGNLPHAGKIDDARIRAAPADDQLRPLFFRQLFQVVVIDGLGFFGHAIRNDAISLAGKIQMMAVSQVSAVGQVESEDGIAGLQHRRVGFHVGLGSGMRLHVGVFRSEQFLGPLARQLFHHVGKLAAAVVALAGISLGILVGEHRAHGLEHGLADKILGSNQLQTFVLAANFVVDGSGDLRIGFVEGERHAVSFHDLPFELLAPSF